MKEIINFESKNGNTYLYSKQFGRIFYLPSILKNILNGNNSENEEDEEYNYYRKKYLFLKNNGVFSNHRRTYTTKILPKKIQENLSNLKQLLIEVTDDCNLNCYYCGYGKLYNNYDDRKKKSQTIENVSTLIDYLFDLWKSSSNLSQNNVVTIGFYGGEPLLNFRLIKETIEYVEEKKPKNILVQYNMTTNGVLLDKYADYLYEKQFRLLLSLDGDKQGNSYRLTRNRKSAFEKIYSNIIGLKTKYPDYFNEFVNINAVLHDRNSVKDIIDFCISAFNKTPRIAELNGNGIDEKRQEAFKKIFRSRLDDIYKLPQEEQVEMLDSLSTIDPRLSLFDSFINNYCCKPFHSFNDLIKKEEEYDYIPTGTCLPFYRKIFLTVNGKLMPCERVGHEKPLGLVENGKVLIDIEYISMMYKELFDAIVKKCTVCFFNTECGQCIFYLKLKDKKFECQGFVTKNEIKKHLCQGVTFAENYPNLYEKIVDKLKYE